MLVFLLIPSQEQLDCWFELCSIFSIFDRIVLYWPRSLNQQFLILSYEYLLLFAPDL